MNAMTEIKTSAITLAPSNMTEAMEFAQMMAKSNIVPKDYQGNPGNVLVAVQWGMEVGLQPLQAMQNIAVINGRPSLWGDAMLALVQGSGLLEYFHEESTDLVATCTIKRKGMPESVRTFSMDDAKRAGLLGKQGPWNNYPKRMMQMRARGFALRDNFADVLRGMHSAEEQQDMAAIQPTEKAMGPVEVVKHETKTSAVKDRIKRSKQVEQTEDAPAEQAAEKPAATFAVVADFINKCEVPDTINLSLTRIGHLPEDQQSELGEIAKRRIADLSSPVSQEAKDFFNE
jgi:hypothetical protein